MSQRSSDQIRMSGVNLFVAAIRVLSQWCWLIYRDDAADQRPNLSHVRLRAIHLQVVDIDVEGHAEVAVGLPNFGRSGPKLANFWAMFHRNLADLGQASADLGRRRP